MNILVDRANIDSRYTIMPAMPLPTATETLEWVTRIFIASNLRENRTALAQYPAISIDYQFEVNLATRGWLTSLAEEAQAPATTARNEWVLPYFPHGRRGIVASGNRLTARNIQDEINNISPATNYPMGQYYLKYDRYRFFYDRTPMTASPFNVGDEVWVVPCFIAYINQNISLVDLGKCRYGHKVNLSFRMTGESERLMTYRVANFDFLDALQSPLDTKITRHSSSFNPRPAIPSVHTPVAYKERQQPTVAVKYWLEYDEFIRQEYAFRGYFMQHLGAFTAGHYVDNNKLHRLADDKLTIKYAQGALEATATMREVQN